MKLRYLLFLIVGSISFLSCNKSDRDQDTSVSMVESYVYAELVYTNIFNTAYQLMHTETGLYRTASGVLPTCAILTVDTTLSPIKIKINYDTAATCSDADGYSKKGIVNLLQYGKISKTGSKAVISFENYKFQDHLISGDVTIVNKGKDGANRKLYQLTVANGSIKYPNDAIFFACNKTFILTKGDTTQTPTDDAWSIKGTANGLGTQGEPFAIAIDSVLTGNPYCNYATGGLATLTPGGTLTKRKLDFGKGDCKKTLTVLLNGLTKTVSLK